MSTYWNGEPCECRKVTAIVADSRQFPAYWARVEGILGLRIDAVEVNYGDDTFYLDDRGGFGWVKVTEGHGSPRYGHRSLEVEPGSVEPREAVAA